MEIGAKQLGAGCPTGPTMPPGRWISLGGTGASAYAPDFQPLLPVYREWHGCGGSVSGSISAGVPDLGELPIGTRWICNLDDQRNSEFVDRSLPANQARPHHGFAGRFDAGGREQRVIGSTAGRTGASGRVEHAGTDSADETFSRTARSGNFAGFATIGLRGNSTVAFSAGRHGEVSHQSRAHRVGADFAANGSRAIMRTRTIEMASAVMSGIENKDLRKWSGSAL